MRTLKNILGLAATASVFATSAQSATPPATPKKPALEYVGICTQANAANRSEFLTQWRTSENQQASASLNATVLKSAIANLDQLIEKLSSKKNFQSATDVFNAQKTEYQRALVDLEGMKDPAQADKRRTVPACNGLSV